jgi:hypothetical protein
MQNMRTFLGLLMAALTLAACGGNAAAPAKAETITCTAAYRSNVTVGIEVEETFTFTNHDDELGTTFGELMFHAAYDAGGADNERSLRVWVTDAAETAMIHSTLYQIPLESGPQNQFTGGHGFTGLSYSYASDAAAELQYWCTAP